MRGKAMTSFRLFDGYRDHPRICGEKRVKSCLVVAVTGSPPHMRGKVLCVLRDMLAVGITPAYAGKSQKPKRHTANAWDHPRICGEKILLQSCRFCSRGSPPHMRGKGAAAATGGRDAGITPAYAGKSSTFLHNLGRKGDHPRICGKKPLTAYFNAWCIGSPPHMRGKGSGP